MRARVTGHRDRFGVDVEVSSVDPPFPAFIDAGIISDRHPLTPPEEYPEIGSELTAIVVAFTPSGELRLDGRRSMVQQWTDGARRAE
ncbi:hypothetical protein [Actinoplanes sp. G11-F43]|uniref:hypothetical protein n=1 Tax=Actinoplanes sp. G11-F43 TaxID=3424130 RepID=UPI003D34611E